MELSIRARSASSPAVSTSSIRRRIRGGRRSWPSAAWSSPKCRRASSHEHGISWPRGHGSPGLAARSAGPGVQPAHPRRRDANPEWCRRAGGDQAPAAALRLASVRISITRAAVDGRRCARRGSRSCWSITSPGGRDHPPVGRTKRRGADGLARAGPCRAARSSCRGKVSLRPA
jgi:hypothetical protein